MSVGPAERDVRHDQCTNRCARRREEQGGAGEVVLRNAVGSLLVPGPPAPGLVDLIGASSNYGLMPVLLRVMWSFGHAVSRCATVCRGAVKASNTPRLCCV